MLQEVSDCGNWKTYGSLNPKFLVAGHSHTYAMYLAIQNDPRLSEKFAVATQFDFSSHRPQDDAYWEYVSQLSKTQKTFIFWNGNQHNIHFLIESGLEFNAFGLKSRDSEIAIAISRIKELFNPTFEELKKALNLFTVKKNLFLAGTPAPKSKLFLDKRLSNIGTEPFFENIGNELGISPRNLRASDDGLRIFMWEITQKMLAETSAEFNIGYFPTPLSTIQNAGILKENFYTEDLTHANEAYGEHILNEILKFEGAGHGI